MFKNKSLCQSLLICISIFMFSYIFLRVVFMVRYGKKITDNFLRAYHVYAQSMSKNILYYIDNIWNMEEVLGAQLKHDPEKVLKPDFPAYLKMISNKTKGIDNIAVLNGRGEPVASSEPYKDNSFLNDEYLRQITIGKEKIITGLEKSSINPDQNTVKIVNTARLDGPNLYIIVSEINLDVFSQHISGVIDERDLLFTFTDEKGAVVCTNNSILDEHLIMYDKYYASSTEEGEKTVAASGVIHPLYDGQKRIFLSFPVSELGWSCWIALPYSSAMSNLYAPIIYDVFFLIILLIYYIYADISLKRLIIQPVTQLRQAAAEMMAGDYSVRTNIKGNDEISLAAEAFDKMAESVEQWQDVKNRFFINMSHEIKTPLNVIFASVQLIENYKSITEFETYKNKISSQMKIIKQNCYRLMRLTRNLLDISRHDNGFLKINLGNYDIVKIVGGITNSVKKYTEAKGINLVFKSDIDSLIMACDPDMIERILLNLISNSLKFTDKGGTITVNISAGEGNLLLTVKDTGIGIPRDKLDCVFKRFKQADDPFKRNSEGTGIGLSLVKAFVNAHKGDVWVESEMMKGAEFFISLPVRLVESNDDDKGEQTSNTGSNLVTKINIEFSDIYSGINEENI